MEQTSIYKLNKPALSEKVDVNLLNSNMDIIDRELNNISTGSNSLSYNMELHTANKDNPHNVTKKQLGIENVEDKSSSDIRSEITKDNVTNALGYTPYTPNEIDDKFSALETKIDWKEAVETYEDIASAYPFPENGCTVNVRDSDYTYRYNGEEWVVISANAIPKVTAEVDGILSKEDYSNFNDANSQKHTHDNMSVLNNITTTSVSSWVKAAEHVLDNERHISLEEKEKLRNIPSDAEKNVQADWNVEDETSDAYIKNKPQISDIINPDDFVKKAGDTMTGFLELDYVTPFEDKGRLAYIDYHGRLRGTNQKYGDIANEDPNGSGYGPYGFSPVEGQEQNGSGYFTGGTSGIWVQAKEVNNDNRGMRFTLSTVQNTNKLKLVASRMFEDKTVSYDNDSTDTFSKDLLSVTEQGVFNLPNLTANRILAADSNKNLVSSAYDPSYIGTLRVIKELSGGSDSGIKYVMNGEDFNRAGLYHCWNFDNSIAGNYPPNNFGDYYIFALENGVNYNTLLAFTPRVANTVNVNTHNGEFYIGHFWNKVWQGWVSINSNTSSLVYQSSEPTSGLVNNLVWVG